MEETLLPPSSQIKNKESKSKESLVSLFLSYSYKSKIIVEIQNVFIFVEIRKEM